MVENFFARMVEEKSRLKERPKSLMEALVVPGMPDSFYENDFPLPDRKETKHREFTFQPDDD